MCEEWRSVPGFSRYEVSDAGRVRGVARQRPLKTFDVKHRRQITLAREGQKQTTRNVGALVLLAFVGPPPEGHEVSHLNGKAADNRLANLAWETHQQNVDRKREHGTQPSAELHQSAKLTNAQVLEILARLGRGERQTDLAREFGIAVHTITGYKQGRRHVARTAGAR